MGLKLSQLPAVTGPVATTDAFYVVRLGASKRIAAAQMFLDDLVSKAGAGHIRRSLKSRFDDVYNLYDFGAFGDGGSHVMSSGDAAAFNSLYGAVGLNAVAGDETDTAAFMAMFLTAANTGKPCYIPPGTFRISKPSGGAWTATPISGQPATPKVCRIYGAGTASVLRGYNIPAGRGVIEMLGESNAHAVNLEIENLQIEADTSCNKYSFCLRTGDGYCGISLHRVVCKGAQGLALKVASSLSYAQLCFHATQCQFWSNWDHGWGSDTALDVYSMAPESYGSRWDSVLFEACLFWGQADVRAFTLKFHLCLFATPPMRALPYNSTIYIGTATYDNCYFEDALISVASLSDIAQVPGITIRDCHFSSNNNLTPPATVQSSIQCGRGTYEHGPVQISGCRFGGTASYADIDLYGPMSVSILYCFHPFTPINVPPTIHTAGLVRLVTLNPDGEVNDDVMQFTSTRIQVPIMVGPTRFVEANAAGAVNTDENSTAGAASFAQRIVKVDTCQIALTAYSPTHASLPSYALLGTSGATKFALAFDGLPYLYISAEPSYKDYAKLGGLCYAQTADKNIKNSSAITSIFTSGHGTPAIPANFLVAGRKLVIEGGGFISSTGTPTLDFYVNFGAVAICSTLAMAASALTNVGFYFRIEVTVRTIGATGTVIAVGHFNLNGVCYPIVMTATATIDTTGTIIVDPDLKWSVADNANDLTVTAYSVRAE